MPRRTRRRWQPSARRSRTVCARTFADRTRSQFCGRGLYGVVSHSVAQRMREISIRMTVGASKGNIVGLVLREGAWMTGLGAFAGLPLSVWALRLTANLVGPMPAVDWIVLAVVPTIVAAVVLAACYMPARRAANADPASVLRGL